MESILISACLLGVNCKYNGSNNYVSLVEELKKRYILIPICPECLGGLSTPRIPSEILEDKVINQSGIDVTKEYELGAKRALDIALQNNCHIAVLKEKSPSCGSITYDGTFSHTIINRNGITNKLFRENNIKIYNELEIDKLLKS